MSEYDSLYEALDSFEQGMAAGTVKSRKGVITGLDAIKVSIATLLNKGNGRPGVKSVLMRLRKLIDETSQGVADGTLSSLTEVRKISRDNIGKLNTALRLAVSGSLSNSQKKEVATHERDEDKEDEIEYLISAYDAGGGLKTTKHRSRNEHGEERNFTTNNAEDIQQTLYWFLQNKFNKSQLASLVNSVRAGVEHDKEKKTNPKATMDSNDLEIYEYFKSMEYSDIQQADDNANVARELVQNLTKKHDDDLKSLSESYKSLSKRLPAHVNGPFTAIYYPVIPLFKDIDASRSPEKLERAGLTVSKVGSHFLVLENQLLLCLNLKELDIKGSLRLTRDGKMKSVKNSHELDDALSKIMTEINARFPKKYALASHTIVRNPKNPDVAFAWLISEHARRTLTQVLHTTQVDWDIPRHNMQAVKLKHREAPDHRYTKRPRPAE